MTASGLIDGSWSLHRTACRNADHPIGAMRRVRPAWSIAPVNPPRWQPAKPRLRPLRLLVSWIVAAVSLWVAAGIVPGVGLDAAAGAFVVAAMIGVVTAILPPVIAALRLPLTLLFGFVLVLFVDAFALVLADDLFPEV